MAGFNTSISDFNAMGLTREELPKWIQENDDNIKIMIQFLKEKTNQNNESRLFKRFAAELGVSSSTVRTMTRFPSDTYREYYIAICYLLGFNVAETDDFLTRYAKQTKLYAKDIAMDAPYMRLISNPKQFGEECPRETGEPIPVWMRRAWTESFSREDHKDIDNYIKCFLSLKVVGKKTYTKIQLAKDIGCSFNEINEWIKNKFIKNREEALMIAISLGMTVNETNEFLSLCDDQQPLNPGDTTYYEAISDMSGFCEKYPRTLSEEGILEPVNRWILKCEPEVTIKKNAISVNEQNTSIYQEITINGTSDDFRNIIKDSTTSPTSKVKVLSIILDWINGNDSLAGSSSSSWLIKNAGNRKYVQQGFRNPYAKLAWDNMRRDLQADGKSVTRDDFIILGLLLNMNLDTINEILDTVGFRGIHSNNSQLFEIYLFSAWHDHSEFNYDEYDIGMPTSHFDPASGKPLFDLQLFLSQKVDEYSKALKDKKTENGSRNGINGILKKYKDQLRKPPAWYIPTEKQEERHYFLRKEALKQTVSEYAALKKWEVKRVTEELNIRGKEVADYSAEYIKQIDQELAADNNFIIATLTEFINDCLGAWGFEILQKYGPQQKADGKLLDELSIYVNDCIENEDLNELGSLIRSIDSGGRDKLLDIIEYIY